MIRIKHLTVKNFMSVGNVSQAVDFNQENLTLVLGENLDHSSDEGESQRNGTGKTTIINALSYALYGQALTNIKRNNLINKTNSKGMLVTLDFDIGKTTYRIERGRSPSILRFLINGQDQVTVDESQGDSRKTQEDVTEVLGMSHDMFKHIVALNTYSEPFLSMRANDQRAIIEQLLGVTILTEKANQLKEQIKETKDAITEENLRIEAIKTANENIQLSIDQAKSRQKAWNAKKNKDISSFNEAIAQLEKLDIDKEIDAHENLTRWKEKTRDIPTLEKEQSRIEQAIKKNKDLSEKIQTEIDDLENAVCYACGQELHADKKQNIFDKKSNELLDVTRNIAELEKELSDIAEGLAVLGDPGDKPEVFYDNLKEAYEHLNNVSSLKQSLNNKLDEEDPYQHQINDLEKSALQTISWDTINNYTHLKEHQDFLLKLLTNKDSFIRKKIIDQNLSYLNNRLTNYLDRLGLPHEVKFQNDLSVEISQLGQDLDFDNLSRGERNRLILGLSFAFRDVWENLYQGINLLFIDELVDNGLDSAGVENALHVLKSMTRERNKNVFLISHKEELIGRVNNVLKVVKEGGFTSYENDYGAS